jgi:hypothetical protein
LRLSLEAPTHRMAQRSCSQQMKPSNKIYNRIRRLWVKVG